MPRAILQCQTKPDAIEDLTTSVESLQHLCWFSPSNFFHVCVTSSALARERVNNNNNNNKKRRCVVESCKRCTPIQGILSWVLPPPRWTMRRGVPVCDRSLVRTVAHGVLIVCWKVGNNKSKKLQPQVVAALERVVVHR